MARQGAGDGEAGGALGRFELTPEELAGAASADDGPLPARQLSRRLAVFSAGCAVVLGGLGWGAERIDVAAALERLPVALALWALLVTGRSPGSPGAAGARGAAAVGAAGCCLLWGAALLAFLVPDAGAGRAASGLALPVVCAALAGVVGATRGPVGSTLALMGAVWAAAGGPWAETRPPVTGAPVGAFEVVAAELEVPPPEGGPALPVEISVGACPPVRVELPAGGAGRAVVPLAIPPGAPPPDVAAALPPGVRLVALGRGPLAALRAPRVMPSGRAGLAGGVGRSLALGAIAALGSAVLVGLLRRSRRPGAALLGAGVWAAGLGGLCLVAASRGWIDGSGSSSPVPDGLLVLEGTRGPAPGAASWVRVVRRPAPAVVTPTLASAPSIVAAPGDVGSGVPALLLDPGGSGVRASLGSTVAAAPAVDFVDGDFDPGFRVLDERVNTFASLGVCWRRGPDGRAESLGPWPLGEPLPSAPPAGAAAPPAWLFAGLPLGVTCLAGRIAPGEGQAFAGPWHPEDLALEAWVRVVGSPGD